MNNEHCPTTCAGGRKVKLTSIPSLHKNNQKSNQMPKREFMCWCWTHGREIAEMVTELDAELFDRLWPDIANIFSLTEDGVCAACEKDCDTCIHKDSGPSSPCWLCCDGESFYTRRVS